MSVTVKHPFVSAVLDSADTSLVRPSNWNADHTIIGLGTAAEKDVGVANGVASLDAGGKVPVSELPAAVLGALSYQGTWNASTNTPTLASGVGVKGYYYVVSVAGSTNLDGVTDWVVGDWAVFNGTVWQKVDNTDAVTSVNGQTGTVVLTQADISGTVPTTRTITASTGLTGGGDLSADRTFAIDSTVATLTGTQTLTNKTLTSPKANEILDTNGNEILGLSPTASATDFLTVKNGIGVGVPLHVYADGSSANIGLHIQPKGTGLVTISDGTDFNKGIRFRSSGSAASAVTLLDAVSTAGRVVTLPDATTTLVGRDTTDTLTNKSISGSTNTLSNIGNASLTNSAITINGTSTSLGGSISVGTVTSVTGTAPVVSSGGNTPAISMAAATTSVDGYLTSTDWNTFNNKTSNTGTVTSVGGTGTVNGITLTGTVTTSGNLTLGGTLSGVSLTTQVSGTLPVANGGTGTATAFTAGSVVFAGASGVYSQDNASLFFDNTNDRLGVGTATPNQKLQVTGSNSTGFAGATLQNSNGNVGLAGVQFSSDTTYSKSAIAQVRESPNGAGPLVFYVDSNTDAADWSTGDEKMRISAAGDVGIGTTSNLASSKLDVRGRVRVGTGNSSGDAEVVWSNYASATSAWNVSVRQDVGGANNDLKFLRFDSSGSYQGVAMQISSAAGNVGIGTASPGGKLDVVGGRTFLAAASELYACGVRYVSTGGAFYFGASDGTATPDGVFCQAGGSERMRITDAGSLLVGTVTSAGSRFVVSGNGSSNRVAKILGNTAGDVGTAGMLISKFDNNNSTSQVFLQFSINNDSIANGQINGNGANAAAFGTWSDARLKQNIVDLPSQLNFIMALRPVEFDYINSEGGGHQIGFVAQEMQNIYPDAVGKRSDGMLTVTGWSKTEARLIKAIQELKAEIDLLKGN